MDNAENIVFNIRYNGVHGHKCVMITNDEKEVIYLEKWSPDTDLSTKEHNEKRIY
jgi:hypothetical protein